jgi:hypothetical protein
VLLLINMVSAFRFYSDLEYHGDNDASHHGTPQLVPLELMRKDPA